MKNFVVNMLVIILVGYLIRSQINSKKGKGTKEGCFIVQFNRILRTIMIANLLYAASMFVISMGTLLEVWQVGKNVSVGVVVFFGIYLIFPTLVSIMVINIWKITVNNAQIVYRNYLGIKHTYDFREIEVTIKDNRDIVATYNGKKIFKIDHILGASDFVTTAIRYGVLKSR